MSKMPKYIKVQAWNADEQAQLDAFVAACQRRGINQTDAMRQAMDLWVAGDAETVKRLHELPEAGKIDRALGLLADLQRQMGELTDTVLGQMQGEQNG